MNVEEYWYDYAGNRIAKIGELSTTYYLVDTNGALSQVLAEYDENGSLTTYYTRSEELISQERNGVKSYYVYDGFDSVRMLTDGDGNVTDTYTFDAFGNLTIGTRHREKPINLFQIPCFQEAGDFFQKQDLKKFCSTISKYPKRICELFHSVCK